MSDCFMHLVEVVLKRIGGWKEKILLAGKISSHTSVCNDCIQAYENNCKGITDAIAQHWRGDDVNDKMHWFTW